MRTEVCRPFERFIINLAQWNIVYSLLTLFPIRLYREIPLVQLCWTLNSKKLFLFLATVLLSCMGLDRTWKQFNRHSPATKKKNFLSEYSSYYYGACVFEKIESYLTLADKKTFFSGYSTTMVHWTWKKNSIGTRFLPKILYFLFRLQYYTKIDFTRPSSERNIFVSHYSTTVAHMTEKNLNLLSIPPRKRILAIILVVT